MSISGLMIGTTHNIAPALTDTQLEKISSTVVANFQIDDKNTDERRDRMEEIYNLFLQKSKPKNWPFEGASNIIYPLITEAVVNFNALAYPAIMKDGTPCRYKVIGSDNGTVPAKAPDGGDLKDPQTNKTIFIDAGRKENIGKRTSTYMNWQLLKQQPWWQPETDKLTMIIGAVGCAFRKVCYVKGQHRVENRLVLPQNLVVDVNASCMSDAGRTSELYQLYPYQIEENIRSGLFIEFDYGMSQESLGTNERDRESSTTGDEDLPHLFVDQYTRLDLDEDGYAEPYIVTFHKQTAKVVRIISNAAKEGVQIDPTTGKIIRIVAREYFIKYGFVPDPTGSIYDLGFGDLLYAPNHIINTALNQIHDSATLAALGGGFLGRGLRLKGGVTRFKLGEWKQVDSAGGNLRENIVPLPTPEPPRVLFELFGAILEAGRSLAAMTKVFSGDVPANVPATTMLAAVEQSMQPFKAVYKRVYKSLSDEFDLLAKNNAEFADPMEYKSVTESDNPQSDFTALAAEIIPVCDPEFAYPTQRLMKAQFLSDWKEDQYVNGYEIRKEIFKLANIEDGDKLLLIPQPPPPTPVDMANAKYMNSMAAVNEANIMRDQVKTKMEWEAHLAGMQTKRIEGTAKLAVAAKDIAKAEETKSTSSLGSDLVNLKKEVILGDNRAAAENQG